MAPREAHKIIKDLGERIQQATEGNDEDEDDTEENEEETLEEGGEDGEQQKILEQKMLAAVDEEIEKRTRALVVTSEVASRMVLQAEKDKDNKLAQRAAVQACQRAKAAESHIRQLQSPEGKKEWLAAYLAQQRVEDDEELSGHGEAV